MILELMDRKLFLNEVEENRNQEQDSSTQMLEEKPLEQQEKSFDDFGFLVPTRFTKSANNLDDEAYLGLGGVAKYQEYLTGIKDEEKPLQDVVKDLIAVIKKKDDQINFLQAVTHKPSNVV